MNLRFIVPQFLQDNWKTIIPLVLVVVFIYINFFRNSLSQWHNQDAASYLPIAIQKFGQPSQIGNVPGGVVVWNKQDLQKKGLCYERVELMDESIPHCKPAKHVDYLYTYVNYDVKPNKFLPVTSLSGSVAYDPLKKWLRARCATEEANIATLALATQIGQGIVDIKQVQKTGMYGKWIKSTTDADATKKLYDLLCHNVQNQIGNPKSDGYWPLAFPEGC